VTTDWQDLAAAAGARGITVLLGIPTREHADLHSWAEDQVNGWLDVAHQLGVPIVYAEEVTAGAYARGIQIRLEEARPFVDNDALEARVDALDLAIANVLDDSSVIGWAGEWRFGGVAHGFDAVTPPAGLTKLAAEVDELVDALPTPEEHWRLRRLDIDERQAAHERERQGRFDTLAAALAAHPDFPACTNPEKRSNLLRAIVKELGQTTAGLNRGEIIEEARRLRESAASS
jgi:hypothetical protein